MPVSASASATMRPIVPLLATCRQRTPKRHITTKPATFANIKYELLCRPAQLHRDRLNPENQHLLAVSLNAYLPDEAKIPPRPDDLCYHKDYRLLQGSHLVYCPPHHTSSSLLPDGTDADHSPGVPFTRRLWAGGSVVFERLGTPNHDEGPRRETPPLVEPDDPQPSLWGTEAVCTETITDVRLAGVPPGEEAWTRNTPGAGEKIYVDVLRVYEWGPRLGKSSHVEAGLVLGDHPAIKERRTLCFMTPKTAEEMKKDVESPHRRAIRAPSHEPEYTLTLTPTPALLFRFSALTFNAHRIHLDRQHCREVEGYRDLLVHGPLLLTMLFAALRGAFNNVPRVHGAVRVKSLSYRNLAPVYVNEEMRVCVRRGGEDKWGVWILGPEGGLCVKGTAIVEESKGPT